MVISTVTQMLFTAERTQSMKVTSMGSVSRTGVHRATGNIYGHLQLQQMKFSQTEVDAPAPGQQILHWTCT